MKTLISNSIQFIYTLLIISLVLSCSNDNENDDSQGGTNITFTVGGSAAANLNGVYTMNYPDNDNQAATSVYAGIYNEDTSEGTVKVVSLTYSYFVSDTDYYDVTLKLPASIGSHNLGEFQTTSTGIISVEPTFHTVISFDPLRAFYDGNNDSNNDILTDLLSKNVVVTITEFEESTNSLGFPTIARIKGTIGSSGNQFFFKAFTGPTSDPEELLCNVTIDFEYNDPNF
jgi:hypothetical protein